MLVHEILPLCIKKNNHNCFSLISIRAMHVQKALSPWSFLNHLSLKIFQDFSTPYFLSILWTLGKEILNGCPLGVEQSTVTYSPNFDQFMTIYFLIFLYIYSRKISLLLNFLLFPKYRHLAYVYACVSCMPGVLKG